MQSPVLLLQLLLAGSDSRPANLDSSLLSFLFLSPFIFPSLPPPFFFFFFFCTLKKKKTNCSFNLLPVPASALSPGWGILPTGLTFLLLGAAPGLETTSGSRLLNGYFSSHGIGSPSAGGAGRCCCTIRGSPLTSCSDPGGVDALVSSLQPSGRDGSSRPEQSNRRCSSFPLPAPCALVELNRVVGSHGEEGNLPRSAAALGCGGNGTKKYKDTPHPSLCQREPSAHSMLPSPS